MAESKDLCSEHVLQADPEDPWWQYLVHVSEVFVDLVTHINDGVLIGQVEAVDHELDFARAEAEPLRQALCREGSAAPC